jgi:hypothetical protein
MGDDLFDGARHLQGRGIGGEVLIVGSISLPGPILQRVIAPLDGAPFLVLEQPADAGCNIGQVGLSRDGAVVEIAYEERGGFASRAYLSGPYREDPSWSEVAARLLRKDYPGFVGDSVLLVDGRVAVAASGGPIRWFAPESGAWTKVPRSREGWACCFAAHGEFATFMIETIPERVMVARLGEPARELRPTVKGGGTSPIAIAGNRAVWAEGRGRDKNNIYERVELWTGELSEQLGIERERKVIDLPLDGMPRPAFNDGVAVVRLYTGEGADRLAVIRLAEGEVRLLVAPEGLRHERLLWFDRDEIGVMIGPGGSHMGPSTFRRFPIAALPLSRSWDKGVEP